VLTTETHIRKAKLFFSKIYMQIMYQMTAGATLLQCL